MIGLFMGRFLAAAACLTFATPASAERSEGDLALALQPSGQLSPARRHASVAEHGRTDSALELAGRSSGHAESNRTDHVRFWPFTSVEPERSVDDDVRFMTYNVFYRNTHFGEIADLIKVVADADIVSLEEAVGGMSDHILDELNNGQHRKEGEWKLATKWNEKSYWTGLIMYRSDKWESEWTADIPVTQNDDSRGMTGVRLRRKKDNLKFCVFGAHPFYESGGPPTWAEDLIMHASEKMKECHDSGYHPMVFLCDCNTMNSTAVTESLSNHTNTDWQLAHSDGFDQIHIEKGPFKDAGLARTGKTIGKGAGEKYCKEDCQEEVWGWSDHPVPYVDVSPFLNQLNDGPQRE